MASIQFSLGGVWKGLKAGTGVAYKAAFLYLAFVFVTNTIRFYEFAVQATMAFYKLGQHAGI